jgi:nitrate reductase gamma subunit
MQPVELMMILMITAAYLVYAAFWIRFLMHALVWWRATRRLLPHTVERDTRYRVRACLFTSLDVLFLGRLLVVNPVLWIGEWIFHASFFLVMLRHLRYFLNPVPGWVWSMQTPGMIAGYIMPLSLLYILLIRLLTRHEKYASPANMFLLGLVFVISSLGVFMHALFKPNLVDVKLFILGILSFDPAAPPESMLFTLHFALVLVLVLLLPTHIFTAPLVMFEARKRDLLLHGVMHEPGK